MAFSQQAFLVLGYVIGSTISLFLSGFGDVIRCKILTRLTSLVLRALGDTTSDDPTTRFHVRLVWHGSYFLSRSEVHQLGLACKRLMYHDAPSVEGPPGNEIWEVFAYAGMLAFYAITSVACLFYREIRAKLWNLGGWLVLVAITGIPIVYSSPSNTLAALGWLGSSVRSNKGYLLNAVRYLVLQSFRCDKIIRNVLWSSFCFFCVGFHRMFSDPGTRKEHRDHRYRPVKERQIRLLEISRRTPFDTLTCRLVHVAVDEAPPFDVISYTWGDPEKPCGVVVDGQWMRVTENAYRILQQRAPRIGKRMIWLDAMCIDQNNNNEKSLQVGLMGELYGRANRVAVWLGGEKADASEAYNFLMHLKSNSAVFQASGEDLIKKMRSSNVDARWWALIKLLEHPYWKRTWIIQEIVKGKKVHILYGGLWMDWDYFVDILHEFQDFEKGPLLHMTEFGQMGRMMPWVELGAISNIALLRRAKGTDTLLEALNSCRNFDATDVRDKVFAIQNMARSTGIVVNYDESVEKVYIKAAKAMLKTPDTLNFAGTGFDSRLKLPSWVPDWSSPTRTIQGYLYVSSETPYNACGAYKSTQILHAGLTISLPAYDFDSVTEIADARFPSVAELMSVDFNDLANTLCRPMRTVFAKAEALAEPLGEMYTFTNETRYEAYWRTLIVNRVNTKTHPIAEFGKFYEMTKRFLDKFLEISEYTSEQLKDIKFEADMLEYQALTEPNARFMRELGRCVGKRCFAISQRRCMVFAPQNTVVGDRIVIFKGARTPFIVRPRSNENVTDGLQYELVGECYVHGMMDGEAVSNAKFENMVLR